MKSVGPICLAVFVCGCVHPGALGSGATPQAASSDAGAPVQDPWASQTLLQPAMAAPPHALPIRGMIRFNLKNGLEVLLIQNRLLPTVDVSLNVRAGELDETPQTRGIA